MNRRKWLLSPFGGSWTPSRTWWRLGTLTTKYWAPAFRTWQGKHRVEDQGQALEASCGQSGLQEELLVSTSRAHAAPDLEEGPSEQGSC